jgi:sorbitol-specific phosphotransferase system component IIBC
MLFLLGLAAKVAIAFVVALVGFMVSRRFVENRLRYVDAVQSPLAAFVAGGVATIVAIPLTILPFVGLGTAILFGVGVFTGVASGAREIRRRIGAG